MAQRNTGSLTTIKYGWYNLGARLTAFELKLLQLYLFVVRKMHAVVIPFIVASNNWGNVFYLCPKYRPTTVKTLRLGLERRKVWQDKVLEDQVYETNKSYEATANQTVTVSQNPRFSESGRNLHERDIFNLHSGQQRESAHG